MEYDTTGHLLPKNGYGVAFNFDLINGKETLLWETKGWFSLNTHISNDGRYLVRIENCSNSYKDTVLFFYDTGMLIKSYRICDLLNNYQKYHDKQFGYYFLKRVEDYKSDCFVIITRENIEYVFIIINNDVLLSSRKFLLKEYIADIFNSIQSFIISKIYK